MESIQNLLAQLHVSMLNQLRFLYTNKSRIYSFSNLQLYWSERLCRLCFKHCSDNFIILVNKCLLFLSDNGLKTLKVADVIINIIFCQHIYTVIFCQHIYPISLLLFSEI